MMKRMMIAVKGLIALFLFVFLPFTAMAQTDWVAKWSVTPHVGFNSSNMSGMDLWYANFYGDDMKVAKSKRKIGFVAGAEVDYHYIQRLSTAVGVWYSHEGCRYDIEVDGNPEFHFNLLNFTAVENFYLMKGLSIKTGLQLGVMLSASEKLAGVSGDAGKVFKKANFSIPVGLSYEYCNVVLDARYNIGLTDLCNVANLDPNWSTNSFWLTLGYRFGL